MWCPYESIAKGPAELDKSLRGLQRRAREAGIEITANYFQDMEQPLLDSSMQQGEDPEHRELRRRMRFAMVSSLIANIALLAAKIVAYVLSGSKAVLASAADSFVDIASQVGASTLIVLHTSAGDRHVDKSITACMTLIMATWR